MNDRLKFRVWDKENNEYIDIDKGSACGIHPFSGEFNTYELLNKNYMTKSVYNDVVIEQCTGLKDKNGKLIYEGDLVKYKPYCNGSYSDTEIGVVEYGRTGDSDDYSHNKHYEYIVGDDSLADVADGKFKGFECEIIGNIHDNPLLEA